MTREETDVLMELLDTWYRWQAAYFPNLGATVTLYRDYDSGLVDEDEVDARYRKETAEAVEACMDYLTANQRAAVQVMMRNRMGPVVWRSHRTNPAEFQNAIDRLWPVLVRRGLIIPAIVAA